MSNLATNQENVTRVAPLADVFESERDYLIVMDVPGAQGTDIELELDKDRLRVTARPVQAQDPVLYSRDFHIPSGVDAEAIAAAAHAGVLKVTLPKRPEVQPKRIEVAVH